MNEIIKKPDQQLDGFADFDVSTGDADSDQRSGSRLAGTLIKFTNEVRWEANDGTDVTGRELLAVGLRRTEVKWGDSGPIEVRELGPGDRYRDLDVVNETVPRSEWREGPNGKMQGPWAKQHVVEFVDVLTMERFSWPTGTLGGTRAITELRDRLMLMRKFRGPDVYPMLTLADTFMPTRYGGRQRPHLVITRWMRAGGGEVAPIGTEVPSPLLAPPTAPATPAAPATPPASEPAPTPPQARAAPAAPAQKPTRKKHAAALTMQQVSEPTMAEALQDKIPW